MALLELKLSADRSGSSLSSLRLHPLIQIFRDVASAPTRPCSCHFSLDLKAAYSAKHYLSIFCGSRPAAVRGSVFHAVKFLSEPMRMTLNKQKENSRRGGVRPSYGCEAQS